MDDEEKRIFESFVKKVASEKNGKFLASCPECKKSEKITCRACPECPKAEKIICPTCPTQKPCPICPECQKDISSLVLKNKSEN